ncbi:hypothetical protein BDW74DRAFT_55154 [Aspergillus multicolor]|uniref:uncharacterized protein n=1 Tax=Aspergillus multicolor TaxID=41759 RepID=UPI003CCD8079
MGSAKEKGLDAFSLRFWRCQWVEGWRLNRAHGYLKQDPPVMTPARESLDCPDVRLVREGGKGGGGKEGMEESMEQLISCQSERPLGSGSLSRALMLRKIARCLQTAMRKARCEMMLFPVALRGEAGRKSKKCLNKESRKNLERSMHRCLDCGYRLRGSSTDLVSPHCSQTCIADSRLGVDQPEYSASPEMQP